MARGSRKVRLSRAHGPQPTRSGRSARVGAASLFAGVALLVLAGCGGSGPAAGSPAGQTGSSVAATAGTGTPLFTRSYAITHPSEPNYLALFSGSTQGVADDG